MLNVRGGIDFDPHLSYNYVTNRIVHRLTRLGISLLEKGGVWAYDNRPYVGLSGEERFSARWTRVALSTRHGFCSQMHTQCPGRVFQAFFALLASIPLHLIRIYPRVSRV